MVEKINFAGLNENAFGDSDFIFMRQIYQGAENISRPLAQPVGVLRKNARVRSPSSWYFPDNSELASVTFGACIRSEKYPTPGEKFERNG
jgi:hypothetical protein